MKRAMGTVTFLLLSVVAACSSSGFGSSSGSADGVSGGAFLPPTSAEAGPSRAALCPAAIPDAKDACFDENVICEYFGAGGAPVCSNLARCVKDPETLRLGWSILTATECQNACPWRREEIVEGTPCPTGNFFERFDAGWLVDAGTSTAPGPMVCSFDRSTCGCVSDGRGDAGPGGAGADASSDAGLEAGPAIRRWRCVEAEADCPLRRPPLGSLCVRPMVCSYGKCEFAGGTAVRCGANGVWELRTDSCP